MIILSRVILAFFLLSFTFQAWASSSSLLINEVAWMGSEVSYNNEWIELYNNTNTLIDLDGWVLKADDGTPEINLVGKVQVNEFYLLERTDDNTVPGIEADLIYTGALENSGEILELYDDSKNLIDSVNCGSDWFAGDNITKQTMEKKNPSLPGSLPANWQSSRNPMGTPKAKNSIVPAIEVQLKSPESQALPRKEEAKSVVYPSGVVINEILPSPEGPDAEKEWIEIFNQNSFEVDLSNWQISDSEGVIKIYTFPKGSVIALKEYLIIPRPLSKITLNNNGDGLKLIQPDGKIVDSVDYKTAPRGESFNRSGPEWIWSSTMTPGELNVFPPQAGEMEKASKESYLKEKNKKEVDKEKGLAAISKQMPKPFLPFLVALSLAFFSGILILILKRKVKAS